MVNNPPNSIRIFLSTPHPCPYLPAETASSLVVDPDIDMDRGRLTIFSQSGFRRSGDIVYRPHCKSCNACVSVRVPVQEFAPNRAQKRTRKRNHDLYIVESPAKYQQQHFDLYLRYQQARHPDSEMCDPDPEKYRQFLIRDNSIFYEFFRGEQLLAVAVTDVLHDGLSAVYTFFAPEASARSPGTFAILWQIGQARLKGLEWVYLGYWIRGCQKMSYKSQFQPLQGFRDGRWMPLSVC